MIKLQVEDYCQNGPHFKPELVSGMWQNESPPYHMGYNHTIYCVNKEHCEVVKNHYEEQRRLNRGF